MAKTYQTYRNRHSGMLVGMGRHYKDYDHLELVQVTENSDGSKMVIPVAELQSEIPHPQAPEGQLGAKEAAPPARPRPRLNPRSRRKKE